MTTLANNLGIAQHFGVTPGAVVNWRKRHDDYPAPVDLPFVVNLPIFDLDQVIEWHRKHEKRNQNLAPVPQSHPVAKGHRLRTGHALRARFEPTGDAGIYRIVRTCCEKGE